MCEGTLTYKIHKEANGEALEEKIQKVTVILWMLETHRKEASLNHLNNFT